MQEIPLTNEPHQKFTINLGGTNLTFYVNYKTYVDMPAWSVDIYQGGTLLIAGAMLEPNADLFDLYNLGLGRLIFVGEPVTLDNLGADNHLVWIAP